LIAHRLRSIRFWLVRGHPPIGAGENVVGVPFTEREEISRGLRGELSLRSIARFLKRPASTINREVRRNGGAKDYRAARSDAGLWTVLTAQSPASRQAGDAYPCRAISGKLTRKWPPQQIAGWLMREHPDEEGKRVSLGTIYRSLFIQTRAYLRRNYRHTCEELCGNLGDGVI
jgi:IS30 family transposase|tara:strand:- start:7 stop:525 length:519 start_codon:yes stop_codon:yes gene_type:complete